MQKPPLTFEEFLQSQDLKDWPKYVSLEEPCSLVSKLQEDYAFSAVSESLREHAPLNTNSLSDLENRMSTCLTELKKHAEKIFSLQRGPAYLEEQLVTTEQKIATERINSEEPSHTSEMRKTKVAKHVEESKGRNVENCTYPGFKAKQLLELPRHLEASKLWDLVIKAQHFQPNQEDQDHFFDRIAESFVMLLGLVSRDSRETFFQLYPDCLSQVIYVTFCEALPESIKSFDDDFKDLLVDSIFQWISGQKPRKCVWKKWNLEIPKVTTADHKSERATANVQACQSACSTAAEDIICKDLLEDRKYMADEEMNEDSEHTNDMPKESETVTEAETDHSNADDLGKWFAQKREPHQYREKI